NRKTSDMNKTIIMGRIGRDAESKEVNGRTVINFPLAHSEKWKDKNTGEVKERTRWYECARWAKSNALTQYLTKGTELIVEGVSESRAYVNQSGEAVAITVIQVSEITFTGANRPQNNQASNNQVSQPVPHEEPGD